MTTAISNRSVGETSPLDRPLLLAFLMLCYVMLALACGGSSLPSPTMTPMPTDLPSELDLVATGEVLARTSLPTPCVVCHSADDNILIGTGWQGYYGSQVTLVDGTTVTVDDEYIRQSIVDPNARVVEGFGPSVMPQSYGDVLSDEDIEAILAYIKSLQ